MPADFSATTAEHVIAAVEAVFANGGATSADFVAEFADISRDHTASALRMAADLGFLTRSGTDYSASSPLCRFVMSPSQLQKAAVLRVVLESYEPFLVFRARLLATQSATTAAQQTRTQLHLQPHRDEVRDTLTNLGTYSQALVAEGGGRFRVDTVAAENPLRELADACDNAADAEIRIREQLGQGAVGLLDYGNVIVPLGDALLRAKGGDGRGAVVTAANAVESFLVARAQAVNVNLTNANGINAKLERFRQAGLSDKIVGIGHYLGHVRNAADHGVDAAVNAAWIIRPATGVEYVFVACSFIAATAGLQVGQPPTI
jgi:hypothetical protein